MSEEETVIFIDCMNLFIRSYAAYPSMSSHGYQVGGVVGFMKTMTRILEDVRPQKVYAIWEGGGSVRRRALFSEYKAHRKPEKLNRFYGDDIPETSENKEQQIRALVSLLNHTPITQVYVQDCEADDVIGYLCKKFTDSNKVIVSSDKDFYQLLDDKTRIYSLHKKTFIGKNDVFSEFGITPQNFALAKCLCGDTSDNINGVPGIGFKTAAKRFPILSGEQELLISNIVEYAHAHSNEAKVYKSVIENVSLIERNWKLVNLGLAMISADQISKIEEIVDNKNGKSNKINFIKRLIEEGITTFDAHSFFMAMSSLEG